MLEVFLHGFPGPLLDLDQMVTEVLAIIRYFLLELLDELLVNLDLSLADILNLFDLLVGACLHLIYLTVESVIIFDKTLAILLLYRSNEVLFTVGDL